MLKRYIPCRDLCAKQVCVHVESVIYWLRVDTGRSRRLVIIFTFVLGLRPCARVFLYTIDCEQRQFNGGRARDLLSYLQPTLKNRQQNLGCGITGLCIYWWRAVKDMEGNEAFINVPVWMTRNIATRNMAWADMCDSNTSSSHTWHSSASSDAESGHDLGLQPNEDNENNSGEWTSCLGAFNFGIAPNMAEDGICNCSCNSTGERATRGTPGTRDDARRARRTVHRRLVRHRRAQRRRSAAEWQAVAVHQAMVSILFAYRFEFASAYGILSCCWSTLSVAKIHPWSVQALKDGACTNKSSLDMVFFVDQQIMTTASHGCFFDAIAYCMGIPSNIVFQTLIWHENMTHPTVGASGIRLSAALLGKACPGGIYILDLHKDTAYHFCANSTVIGMKPWLALLLYALDKDGIGVAYIPYHFWPLEKPTLSPTTLSALTCDMDTGFLWILCGNETDASLPVICGLGPAHEHRTLAFI